jgi:nitrite reductase/ring-hydroxylating ferredoxin subunit
MSDERAGDDAADPIGVDEVAGDDTLLVTVRDGDGEDVEAILLSTDDGVRAWRNYCQHLTHIALDKGSGAPVRDGEVLCANHGAMFDVASGLCTHGPCEGATLERIAVRVEDGVVRFADDRYEFVERGGVDDGDDLASESNVIL